MHDTSLKIVVSMKYSRVATEEKKNTKKLILQTIFKTDPKMWIDFFIQNFKY